MNKSKMFIEHLNIYDGNITYNDFDIDERISFDEQKYSYKMDILQITFGPRYILDVGWGPEFNPNGFFLVQVIRDYDWLNPIVKKKCRSLVSLKKTIEKTAELLSREAKK